MEEQKNTPKLRFPGFEGEWDMKKLGSLLEFKNGINATKEQYGSGYKFINVLDILNNDFITHDKIIGSVNVDEELVSKFPVKYGDILFQRSSETREEVGTASVYLDKDNIATFGGFVIRGRKIGEYNPVFLNKLLKTDLAREQITSKSGGSTRYNVGQEILASVLLPFPSLPEQIRIASFFTVLDREIVQLKQKKSLLEQYKRGMMQKLFSQELRFKDKNGYDFPNWEKKRFGDVFSFRTTNSYSRDNLNYEQGIVKNIHYGDIHTKFNSHFDITKENVPFINPEIDLKKNPEDTYCKVGDLIIADASEDYEDVGKCIEIVNLNGYKVLAGLHTILARPDLFRTFLGFSGHLMQSENIRLQIKIIAQGSKVLSIAATRLANITIDIPSLEEQTKIANFLSALDEKIKLTQIQIRKTENWKSGVLQNMFC